MKKIKILRLVSGILIAGAVAVSIAIPSKMFLEQKHLNEKITIELNKSNDERKIQQEQLQKHQNESKRLLKQVNDLSKEIKGLEKSNKELKAKNSELEGVRLSILNSTGYVPSSSEIDLLERLVECEAGAEPFEGKIAVVNVIQNRIRVKEFPNTITDIIYQKNQFEPVVTGMINNRVASKESKEAVKRALQGERVIDSNILNFWADYLPKDNPLWQHIQVSEVIGTQCFGTSWN